MQVLDDSSELQGSSTSRRRASKACLACRARKVRCDVVLRDGQCTNCALDKRQCAVKPRPSKYRSKKKANMNREVLSVTPASPLQEQQRRQQEFIGSGGSIYDPVDQATTLSGISLGQSHTSPPFNHSGLWNSPVESSNDNICNKIQREGKGLQPCALSVAPHASNDELASGYKNTPEEGCCGQSHVIYTCFPFLKADLSIVSEDDAQFLEVHGCFKVPGRDIADEFVRQYFLHVHPNLPLLDESVFWDMYAQNCFNVQGRRASLSLFVFQAMIFTSCSFLPLATIRALGFTSVLNARATYYRRAKLLFDFCGEMDPISNAQGALLLSYNATMRDQKRANSIWLATAIQLAQSAGAHKFYVSSYQKPESKNSLKRLWWCCIVRDRILPLGVRRQLHIPLADFDLKEAALTEADFVDEIGNSRVYEAETKRPLIRLFITLCDLAVILTDVIMTAYGTGQPMDVRLSSMPKVQKTVDSIQSCKLGLDSWFERATIRFPTPAGIVCTNESLILYTNLMYIYYHSARLALYQYEALILSASSIGPKYEENRLRQSRIHLEDATAGITDNLKELIQLKLGKYLPISVVAYAALPLVLHILDVKLSTKPSHTAQKQGRLNVYIEAMKGLQLQYDGVDDVWYFIRTAVECATQDDPAQEPIHSDLGNGLISTHLESIGGLNASGLIATASDWGHMFLQQPTRYFRIAHTIDLSLSTGRFTDECIMPPPHLFRIDMRFGSNISQGSEIAESSDQNRILGTGDMSSERPEEMTDKPCSTLDTLNEGEHSTTQDYGLGDIPIPISFDSFDLLVEDWEGSLFSNFLS